MMSRNAAFTALGASTPVAFAQETGTTKGAPSRARSVRVAATGTDRYIGNTGFVGLEACNFSGPAGGVVAKLGVG
jgi:hypothetical protein